LTNYFIIIIIVVVAVSVCYGYRKAGRTGTEHASGDDKKRGKSQSQKDEATSGGDPMYFNNISRSAPPSTVSINKLDGHVQQTDRYMMAMVPLNFYPRRRVKSVKSADGRAGVYYDAECCKRQ